MAPYQWTEWQKIKPCYAKILATLNEPAHETMVPISIGSGEPSAQSPQSLRCSHTKYGSKQRVWPKIRHLAPLDCCTSVWRISLWRTKSTIISWDGSNELGNNKTNKKTANTDLSVHSCAVWSIFVDRMSAWKHSAIHTAPYVCWPDCTNVHDDISLWWAHILF